jgi:DNA-binding XRE family transcriptional regulator
MFVNSKKVVPLPKIYKTYRFKVMMFNERIKQLCEDRQIPQRKLAAAMDIDTASYCKIEKSECRTRKEHISINVLSIAKQNINKRISK